MSLICSGVVPNFGVVGLKFSLFDVMLRVKNHQKAHRSPTREITLRVYGQRGHRNVNVSFVGGEPKALMSNVPVNVLV